MEILIQEPMVRVLGSIFVALTLSLAVGPLAIFLAKKIGAIDVPGSAAHKKHSKTTPLAGGLVIVITLPVLIVFSGLWRESVLYPIFLGGVVIFFFGIADDIVGFSASKKFSGQFLATSVLVYSGMTVRFLETANLPLSLSVVVILSWALTFFWVVGITNAFNLIDSMDGLLAGLTVIMASFFTFFALMSGQVELAQFSALLVGVSVVLYFYNRTPAHFFLGDSGSQLIGFLLSAIAILYRPPDLHPGSTWFVPILLLAVPIFDTSLVTLSRLRRGKPLFQADRAHTYHRLVQLGFSAKQAVLVIHISAFLLSLLALLAMFLPPNTAMLLFFCTLLLGGFLIVFFEVSVKIEE